jgi:sugar phosphate isomerase/epimerase
MNVSRREFLRTSAAGAAAATSLAAFGKYSIGVVGPASDFEKSVRYGFDYHEAPVWELAHMSEAEFSDFKQRVLGSPLRCRRCNMFTAPAGKPGMRVVGPEVDTAAARAYVEKALARCRELGAEIVVWGSARSRNVPEGFPRERAWGQIADFLRMVEPIARAQNITIGIEPLSVPESNILNTGGEVLKMQRELNLPRIKMIIDYYHLAVMKEDPEILCTAHDQIIHLHFANPHGRVWPRDPAEDPGYSPFFQLVKKSSYRGGISIEGKGTYEESAVAALAFFQTELAGINSHVPTSPR